MQLQVPQPVLLLEVLLMVKRGLADVDAHHLRGAVLDRKSRCLVGAASRDENVDVGLECAIGKKLAVKVARFVPMPDAVADCFEILDWQRVPPPLVLARDDVFTRVNFHRGIMSYRSPRPQASLRARQACGTMQG